ncbi:MAG: HAMP domain-containing sensor histidine kinase, partial [Pseudomonadota bacterium]
APNPLRLVRSQRVSKSVTDQKTRTSKGFEGLVAPAGDRQRPSKTACLPPDALHEALITKDALAQVAAHDLRTPLNSLTGLVHLIELELGADMSGKAREYIGYMNRAVRQMDGTLATFLDHIDRSTPVMTPGVLDMRASVDHALTAVMAQESSAQTDVVGPTWTVRGDPDLLHLLLSHVLRNAVQHPHPGRPLEVRVEMSTRGRVGITDTGTGFDPSLAHAIFLPVAEDIATRKPAQLGLSICKEICRRHGWQIGARSDGHSGSTIEIEFG